MSCSGMTSGCVGPAGNTQHLRGTRLQQLYSLDGQQALRGSAAHCGVHGYLVAGLYCSYWAVVGFSKPALHIMCGQTSVVWICLHALRHDSGWGPLLSSALGVWSGYVWGFGPLVGDGFAGSRTHLGPFLFLFFGS
jgi:hypothetical protein